VPRLFAIIITYKRPAGLRAIAGSLLAQDRIPDRLVLVSNDGSDAARDVADHCRSHGLETQLIEPGDNLGPAGGTAAAMDWILSASTSDDDWVTRFDDDKELPYTSLVGDLERFATEQLAVHPRLGAVGAVGSRYDFRRGRLIRIDDAELDGPVDVDYVPTNRFPLYRVKAIRETGGFDGRLFFGSSEVEFGLRLRRAGFTILADSSTWKQLGRKTAEIAGASHRLEPWNWRRYYSLRNQVYYLRAFGHPWVAARVALVRGIGKPAANLLVSPRLAATHLRWNCRAVVDGWRGRLGRTVEPSGEMIAT
jgi:GT2 family glycosyltransferase